MNELERALKQAAHALPGEPPSIGERLAGLAAERGVLDVAYAHVDSPLGPLTVAATSRGLVRIAYPSNRLDDVLAEIAERISPRVLEAPARLDTVRRELDEYFQRRRTSFELPLDWSLTRGFTRDVLQVTARIGYGEVRSYAEVATRAGRPRAVRAAGNALGSNPIPVVVPCHRVVRTGGSLGGYTGGLERKQFLLAHEGVLRESNV